MEHALQPTSAAPADRGRRAAGEHRLFTQLLRRPELGAMLGAGVVLLFFAVTTEQFATLSGIARWTDVASTLGIMAVAVALLMIGGEFDLSAGVMTGSTGLLMGILATEVGMNIWLAIALTFVFAAAVGFVNGYMVIRTGLPSFIVTLATFFILRASTSAGRRRSPTRCASAACATRPASRARSGSSADSFWAPHNFRVSVIWWIVITALATWVLMPHAHGQLDLRRGRRQGRRPQRRRPGRTRSRSACS